MSKLSMQIQNRKLKSVSMVYGQSVFVFYLDMFRFHRGKNLFFTVQDVSLEFVFHMTAKRNS